MAVITQDSYDLQPHSVKCDARMAALEREVVDLRNEVVDLRAEVAALKDAMRSMGITIRKPRRRLAPE